MSSSLRRHEDRNHDEQPAILIMIEATGSTMVASTTVRHHRDDRQRQ